MKEKCIRDILKCSNRDIIMKCSDYNRDIMKCSDHGCDIMKCSNRDIMNCSDHDRDIMKCSGTFQNVTSTLNFSWIFDSPMHGSDF